MATFLFVFKDHRLEILKSLLENRGHKVIEDYNANDNFDYVFLPFQGINNNLELINLILKNPTKKYIVYNLDLKLNELKRKYNLKLIELKKDKKLIKINNKATSQGVLKEALERLKTLLNETNILLLGYGSLGEVIYQDFRKFRKPSVMIRDKSLILNLKNKGYKIKNLKLLNKEIAKFDLIINTIPFNILTKDILNNIKKDALIIDVASFPFGANKETLKTLNLNYLILKNLPSKYASLSVAKRIFYLVSREAHDA